MYRTIDPDDLSAWQYVTTFVTGRYDLFLKHLVSPSPMTAKEVKTGNGCLATAPYFTHFYVAVIKKHDKDMINK
jgi:hypothetical protein